MSALLIATSNHYTKALHLPHWHKKLIVWNHNLFYINQFVCQLWQKVIDQAIFVSLFLIVSEIHRVCNRQRTHQLKSTFIYWTIFYPNPKKTVSKTVPENWDRLNNFSNTKEAFNKLTLYFETFRFICNSSSFNKISFCLKFDISFLILNCWHCQVLLYFFYWRCIKNNPKRLKIKHVGENGVCWTIFYNVLPLLLWCRH